MCVCVFTKTTGIRNTTSEFNVNKNTALKVMFIRFNFLRTQRLKLLHDVRLPSSGKCDYFLQSQAGKRFVDTFKKMNEHFTQTLCVVYKT